MRTLDLQSLPRFADGLTFLYVEKARIEQEASAIVLVDESGRVPVPVAALAVLMLGPGTSVTHAAMVACADNGCSVLFSGEAGVRLYASGIGETRRAANLLEQARAWADAELHMQVVLRMYRMRFAEDLDGGLTLEQVRGKEGVRVREAYARASVETGVPWTGRSYRTDEWTSSTPVNRALSTANACLYGLCHAAIVSTGFSPGLGFVHTGKALAFVYDVADLYKCETTVPLAFEQAKGPLEGLEARTRLACRNAFRRTRLIERIVPDMQRALGLRPDVVHLADMADEEPRPELWGPDGGAPGARNYAAPVDEDLAHVHGEIDE
jgi:CRISPR-associated protein Cas1